MQIKLERLPKNLLAATEKMMASGSLAREVLGDDFVEHYGATRVRSFHFLEENSSRADGYLISECS